jgi:hypothetical protein
LLATRSILPNEEQCCGDPECDADHDDCPPEGIFAVNLLPIGDGVIVLMR